MALVVARVEAPREARSFGVDLESRWFRVVEDRHHHLFGTIGFDTGSCSLVL